MAINSVLNDPLKTTLGGRCRGPALKVSLISIHPNTHSNATLTFAVMFMPTSNRRQIYENLFNEGVVVVRKDGNLARHPEIPVPNLHVMKALQGLLSKNLVTHEFVWQYHYYFLNDEGIVYLREYLHLPESVVPASITKAKMPSRPPMSRGREEGKYREKKVGAQADFKPQFQGGYGRGKTE